MHEFWSHELPSFILGVEWSFIAYMMFKPSKREQR